MGVQVAGKPDGKYFVQHILLISCTILLPGINSALLGWAYFLLPLVAFYYLFRFGSSIGGKFIISAILLALVVSFFIKTLPQVIFSLTLIPAGYTLNDCAQKGEGIITSGFKTVVTILLTWMIYMFLFPAGNDASIHSQLLKYIDTFIADQIDIYRADKTLSADKLLAIEEIFNTFKIFLQKIVPSLFITTSILITWTVMVTSNHIVLESNDRKPWPEIQYWQLPERLIWVFISSVILLLLFPGEMSFTVGANILIVVGLLYCLQGFSIVVHFFNKWNLPRLVRFIFYVMIFLQAPGQFILLVLGFLNTWIDFRKIKLTEQNDSPYKKDE